MTDQRHLFRDFTSVASGVWQVKGIGSSNLSVHGHGTIDFIVLIGRVEQKTTVDRVLFLPGLGANLISIAAVTEVGLSVHFAENNVFFMKDNAPVIEG